MKPIKHLLLPLAALAVFAVSAHAQGPGGPGGFPAMSPAAMAKIKAWQQWSGTHKNYRSLQRTIGALDRMEQDPKTKLNKAQAHAVLAVINKWKGKPSLTDAQARQVDTQLTAPLNLTQIKAIATASQGRGGFGGGRGPGGGGPGGGRGPGGGGRPGGFGGGRPGGPGGGPRFDPASMPAPHEYNPLNPATSPMAHMPGRGPGRGGDRLAKLIATLAATK